MYISSTYSYNYVCILINSWAGKPSNMGSSKPSTRRRIKRGRTTEPREAESKR